MLEEHVNDGMIEIGDPTEEPKLAPQPPQVVIEYRERGIPWMLVPPLLILSAVGAVFLYHKFAPQPVRPQTASLVKAPAIEEIKIPISNGPLETGKPIAPLVAPAPAAPPVEKPPVIATPAPEAVVSLPTPAAPPVEPPPTVSEPPAVAEKPADPPAFPRVQGLGFDPKAFEPDRKTEPTADRAIAATSKEARPDQGSSEVNRGAAPNEREQPTEVDPDLLPPDPRLAKIRQQERQANALQQVEIDRTQFHADLKGICLKFRENSKKPIRELVEKYGVQVEPRSKETAAYLLNGKYVGADRLTRMDILRASGFPESLILVDMYESYEVRRIGERDGPLDDSEAMYRSGMYLLKHPPAQNPAIARAVANARTYLASRPNYSTPPSKPGIR